MHAAVHSVGQHMLSNRKQVAVRQGGQYHTHQAVHAQGPAAQPRELQACGGACKHSQRAISVNHEKRKKNIAWTHKPNILPAAQNEVHAQQPLRQEAGPGRRQARQAKRAQRGAWQGNERVPCGHAVGATKHW